MMAPKAITSEVFKHRKEIGQDILEKLIVKGGPVSIKETIKEFDYAEEDTIALPTITVAGDGRIGGIKWTVLGKPNKKVNIKANQLWPESPEEVFINLEVPDFDTFTFYNKCRNVSGWIDSKELTWTVVKKGEKGKKVTIQPSNYEASLIKGFSIRLGVLPVSVDSCTLTVAIISLSKEEMKKKFNEKYNKTYCPQIALIMGESNVKTANIKLGLKEKPEMELGMGILPVIQDVRSNDQIADQFPTSLEIRKSMAHFLRSCQGFSNKIPRTLQEAMTEGQEKWVAIEPEFMWPEAHSEENDIPLEDLGM